jgi:hypothetical protein
MKAFINDKLSTQENLIYFVYTKFGQLYYRDSRELFVILQTTFGLYLKSFLHLKNFEEKTESY